MKKILLIGLFIISSIIMMGQTVRIDETEEQVNERVIASATFCIPIVTETDSLYILKCQGIYMEIVKENLTGELVYVIIPSGEEATTRKTVYLPMPPEENFKKE
jgi:hypothetical protein